MSDFTLNRGASLSAWAPHVIGWLGAASVSAVTILWLAAHRDAQIEDHERRIVKIEVTVGQQADKLSDIRDTLARVDERVFLLLKSAPALAGQHK